MISYEGTYHFLKKKTCWWENLLWNHLYENIRIGKHTFTETCSCDHTCLWNFCLCENSCLWKHQFVWHQLYVINDSLFLYSLLKLLFFKQYICKHFVIFIDLNFHTWKYNLLTLQDTNFLSICPQLRTFGFQLF